MSAVLKYYVFYTLLLIAGILLWGAILFAMVLVFPSAKAEVEKAIFSDIAKAILVILLASPPFLSAVAVAVDFKTSYHRIDYSNSSELEKNLEIVTRYAVYIANNTLVKEDVVNENRRIIAEKKSAFFRWLVSPIIISVKQDQIVISASKSHIRLIKKYISKYPLQGN
jgi:hypothetical protein